MNVDMGDYVSFKLANKLKEIGFDFPVVAYYDKWGRLNISDDSFCFNSKSTGISAPDIHQVLKWLREKKKIFVSVNICWCFEDEEHPFFEVKEPIFKGYYSSVYFLKDLAKQDTFKSDNYDSFEQAALAGIEYVLNSPLSRKV